MIRRGDGTLVLNDGQIMRAGGQWLEDGVRELNGRDDGDGCDAPAELGGGGRAAGTAAACVCRAGGNDGGGNGEMRITTIVSFNGAPG